VHEACSMKSPSVSAFGSHCGRLSLSTSAASNGVQAHAVFGWGTAVARRAYLDARSLDMAELGGAHARTAARAVDDIVNAINAITIAGFARTV
jgi:hypothetical protein